VTARLRAAFERAAQHKRAALLAYLTFGEPDVQTSISVVEAAARAGADVIELGVPFSDPSADGPSIQRAMERALERGASLPGALDAVAELRRRGIETPIVLFGYYNPIFVMGPAVFAARAATVGVDAVLTFDLPIDELAELATPLAAHGVSVIPLVAPTSTPERIARLAPFAAPFIYYISLTGVTGSKAAAAVDPAHRADPRRCQGPRGRRLRHPHAGRCGAVRRGRRWRRGGHRARGSRRRRGRGRSARPRRRADRRSRERPRPLDADHFGLVQNTSPSNPGSAVIGPLPP
jgi:tryptophan synthase alpha chain